MSFVKVSEPTFEQHHNGRGVHFQAPRISWRFEFVGKSTCNWQQIAYDIEIEFLKSGEKHTSSAETSNSILEPWPARPLKSGEEARVRVRCHGTASHDKQSGQQETSDWSNWSVVEAALLYPNEWTAHMITAPSTLNQDGSLIPVEFFKDFELPRDRKITRARLYITSQGCYYAFINKREVGDHFMNPGWQSYKHRIHYQTFDVKDHLQEGNTNTIRVIVAAGWYAGALAWAGGRRCMFGNELGVMAQLQVSFEDAGEKDFIFETNDQWQCTSSAIVSSELYDGEIYDAGLDTTSPSSEPSKAKVVDFDTDKLISPNAPPVRITQEVEPVEIFKSPSGRVLIDFGQNLVGRLCVKKLQKQPGQKVVFRHAEVLENGELGVRPLRGAKATDTIVFGHQVLENWTPKFTFHGFRYVEVEGWTPEDPDYPLSKTSIVAQVIHSDMQRTGWFSCSKPLVNKLHDNVIWSMRGNFLSVPTDCPQRDERLGWTGDLQVFAPSANFLYNTSGLLGNWLDDLAAEQMEPWRKGVPPFVVPDVVTKTDPDDAYVPAMPNAVWDDVAVLLPWAVFMASGDAHILEKQYQSMKLWLNLGISRGSDRLWDPSIFQLGDWLDPTAPPDEPGNARTDGVLVADEYLIRVTGVMGQVAAELGLASDASEYSRQAQQLKKAFHDKYVSKVGLLVGDTQTALSLAILFNILEDKSQLATAGQRLARSVQVQHFRVSTGFAGTPAIAHALTAVCQPQLAYRMLMEKTCPSWLYPITMGATTIWERWDSMLADGSINPGEMTSFNHYALGSIANWLHETVAGISPMAPGWKKIKVRPVPGGGLTHASAAHEGPYGRIECGWKIADGNFTLELLVPPNSTAYVILPSKQAKEVGDTEEGISVGSGRHVFEDKGIAKSIVWPPEVLKLPFSLSKLEPEMAE